MTPRWYEKAEEQLERDYAEGHLSMAEFQAELRELNAELRGAADEAAENARDEYLGW
jgi:hypothetical protein